MLLKFILTSFFFTSITSLSHAGDLRVDETRIKREISEGKQYYVRIRCSIDNNIKKYVRKLNGQGELLGANSINLFGINRAVTASHYIVLSDTKSISTNGGKIVTSGLNVSSNANIFPVFASDSSRSNRQTYNFSQACDSEFFLHGKAAQYLIPVLAVSSAGDATKVIAATTNFVSTALGIGSKIIRDKAPDTDATDDIQSAKDTIDAIETYHDALSGNGTHIAVVPLGVGQTKIRTGASVVTVSVGEHESYLKADGVPFVSKSENFISKTKRDALEPASSELSDTTRKALDDACRAFNTDLSDRGLKSEYDRAYLLGIALSVHSPDKKNVIRCFKEIGLEKVAIDPFLKRMLMRKNVGEAVIYSAGELSNYETWYRDIDAPDTEISPPVLSSSDVLKRQKQVITKFLNYISHFVGQQDPSENKDYERSKLDETAVQLLHFRDSADLIGYDAIGHPTEILAGLSEHGFNRFNCFFQKTNNHVTALGDLTFGDAQFALLAHKTEPRTLENRNKKILSPDNAVVVRGYIDADTNKIVRFETSPALSEPFFVAHSTCRALLAPSQSGS